MYQQNQNFLPYPPSLLQGLILQQQNNNLTNNNNNKPPPLMNQQHRMPLMNQPPSLLTMPTPLIQFNNKPPNLPIPLPLMSTLQSPLLLLQHQQPQQPVSLLNLNIVPNWKKNSTDNKKNHQNNSKKYKIFRHDLDSIEKFVERYNDENKSCNNGIQIEIQTTDFNHGLSSSTYSTINLKCENPNNDIKIEQKQSKTPPPSLLSLKVAFSSNESSNKRSASSNLFPILNETTNETFNLKIIPVSMI